MSYITKTTELYKKRLPQSHTIGNNHQHIHILQLTLQMTTLGPILHQFCVRKTKKQNKWALKLYTAYLINKNK